MPVTLSPPTASLALSYPLVFLPAGQDFSHPRTFANRIFHSQVPRPHLLQAGSSFVAWLKCHLPCSCFFWSLHVDSSKVFKH